jgi:glycosyltransferase involved in cell wall biosynthesis
MRILVASGTWYPEKNGLSRVATETARKLAERGHEVSALVPAVANLPNREIRGSLTVSRLIGRGVIPLTIKDVLETATHSRRLGAFDVLLAHGSATAVGLSRARLGAPLALVYHASHPRELRFMRPRLPWGRERLVGYVNEPICAMLDRVAVSRFNVILVLSDFTRSLLNMDYPEQSAKIRRVSGGVDTAAFSPGNGKQAARGRLGLDPNRRLVVTARRAEPRMGIEQLLHAIQIAGTDDVVLAVVGGGLLTDKLRRLSSQLGLDSRVRFPGYVSDDELLDWYRAADLFVLPTVAYEGFGMVTVEALACGTPVLGTPVGATPELLGPLDPRLVAQSSDSGSLATAIRAILDFTDDAFRTRCRDYAVKRFDWDVVIRGWEDALREAAAGATTSLRA